MRKIPQRRRKRVPAEGAPEPTVVLTVPEGATPPKLPHERDESPSVSTRRDAKVVQAEHDIAAGQQDTDRYNEASGTFARNKGGRR